MWASVLLGLLSGGLLTAILAWVRDLRQAPIEHRDAHVAAADTLQEMSLRVADAADKRSERTEEQIAQLRTLHESDSERIACLERHSREQDRAITRLQRTVGRWTRWYEDLRDRWDDVRVHPHPPEPPDGGQPADPTT